ncbi:MAG: hypothetical protein ABIX01_22715 [Chitinophagaceae bacterium]
MEMQENFLADIQASEIEASYLQKILSQIIDAILEIGSLVIFYLTGPDEILYLIVRNEPVSNYIVVFTWFMTYRLLTILLLQRTIGMMVCTIKYLNNNLQPLSTGEKMIATFGLRMGKIKMYKTRH